jgi:hypothetical protein
MRPFHRNPGAFASPTDSGSAMPLGRSAVATLTLSSALRRGEAREKDVVLQVDVLDQILGEMRDSYVERLP